MDQINRYSLLTRHLHWIGAGFFIATFVLGLVFADAEGGLAKSLFFFHASFGLAGLGLVAVRLLERGRSKAPAPLDHHGNWERKLAKIIKIALYIVMIALPLSGMLAVWTKGYSVPFFGLFEFTSFIGKNEMLHEVFESVHEVAVNCVYPLLGLHILGALKHHLIDKDETMMRISPQMK